MTAVFVERESRRPLLLAGAALSLLLFIAVADVLMPRAAAAAAALALVAPFVYAQRWFLHWRRLIALTILVVLFIPIKRYGFPGNLPFDFEPYRLVVALVIAGWGVSLLIDPRVRSRKTGLEGPILLIALASVMSEATNTTRIHALLVQSEVIKALMFLASFFLVCYLVVSVVETRFDVERLVEVLCLGGGVVGIFATIEYRTHFNAFDHLRVVMPFLRATAPDGPGIARGGEVRVFASAQHPIALGGLFVMLVPLALYLALRPGSRRWWWIVAGAITLGALSSVSRTSIVMFAAAGLVFFCLRPRQTIRAWPLLVPALVVIQLSLPGVLSTLHSSFFPRGGIVAQQTAHPGWSGSGRLADIGPTMKEFAAKPIFGQGFGTRQPVKHPDTQILDDQWLKTLVETGVVGTLGWLWLFARSIRRLARRSRLASDGGWLEVALAAAVASFAVGMAFYDTFSFIQVTVMLFILLGLAAALARTAPREVAGRVRSVGATQIRLADA
jgi:hypothetical protein